jgi:uncharacterized membrane protein
MFAAALDLFSKNGAWYLARWGHVLVGITWIGLLYYFNFVQVPAFAEMEAAARNNAVDKLASRALWWFRWAALATVVTGLLILSFQTDKPNGDFWKGWEGTAIATGILIALTMFLNVWGVIWRNQKIVIANARNVQAGGEADPAAAAAGRKALLSSRMNTIFSLPMLGFMVGAAHFPPDHGRAGTPGNLGIYWIIMIVIWALFELSALGVIGGTKPGGVNVVFDTHRNAIIAGLVYFVVAVGVFAYVLK